MKVIFLRNHAVKFYCKMYLVENSFECSEDERNSKIHYILAIRKFHSAVQLIELITEFAISHY